jgi:hypothetical protein
MTRADSWIDGTVSVMVSLQEVDRNASLTRYRVVKGSQNMMAVMSHDVMSQVMSG